MIIALLALAFAMIFGGLLAAFFGWDIVLIERGWTMVIAGSFTAGCGAVLLGITAAVSKLARIQSELARLQVNFDEEVREEAPSSSTGLSMAALAGGLLGGRMLGRGDERRDEKAEDEKPADLPPLSNDDRREPGDDNREPGPEFGMPRTEPLLPFPPRTASDEAERREADEEAESKVPDFLLADRLRETYVESRNAQAESSLFADEPRLDEPRPDEPRLHETRPDETSFDKPADERPAETDHDDLLEPVSEPVTAHEPEPLREPEPVRAEEESAAPEEPAREVKTEGPRPGATVIGTYNSGDNTYVMFSDGSIEAQTPGGVFHFKSLDELKAFIASGGEGGTAAT